MFDFPNPVYFVNQYFTTAFGKNRKSFILPSHTLSDIRRVAPVRHDPVSDRFHTAVQAATALCRLLAGTDLMIIQRIFLSHGNRREVRHYNISTRPDPHLTSQRMDCSKCCCRREEVPSSPVNAADLTETASVPDFPAPYRQTVSPPPAQTVRSPPYAVSVHK